MSIVSLELPTALRARLAQGHPWIYRNQVEGVPDLAGGNWVRVRCAGFSAFGLWDEQGAIAVRLFSRQAVPSATWVADRVADAWKARACVRAGHSVGPGADQSAGPTTAYRWVYGESDGLPGIVVDLYGEFAAIQTYTGSVDGLVPWVAEALHAHIPLQGILWRRAGEAWTPIWGRLPPHDLVVEENGLLFYADLLAGQKTGLYFDHRDNRRTLARWCAGQAVLDCFCYTGAFSLYALRAGAAELTACDAAAGAIQAAQRNLTLNGFDPSRHTFLVRDAFEFLEQLTSEGRRYGVVILDPPSLAREKAGRHAAERAYVRLNRLALHCVESGGLLASASCTSQVPPEAFRLALAEAARQAGRRLVLIHEAGQAADHPVGAHFPEARYLKFVVGRVLPLL